MTDLNQEEINMKGEHQFGYAPGEHVRVIDDATGDASIWVGEEGTVWFEQVGAAEYNNLRISMMVQPDGNDRDDSFEVTAEDIEGA
jgi:hypothetical protein